MSIPIAVEKFVGYFRKQLALIASLTGDPSIYVGSSDPEIRLAIHKKILYSALLDSLAGIRYHSERPVHARFVRFLREHTPWPTGHLVSAPILRARLAFPSPLREHIDTRLARYSTKRGNALAITEFDEPLANLRILADSSEVRHLEASEHYELFYKYRNFTVHEFRQPGYAMECFADEGIEPLYHGYINAQSWRLLYPVGFFRARVEAAATSLEQWFLANSINPYDRVRDSSDWYDR